MNKIKICPLVTSFSGNDVDLDKMSAFAEHQFSRGLDYLFVCGTTGLGPALSLNERMNIIEGLDQFSEKIIMQVGSLNLNESLDLARSAKEHGYYAIASLPPYYFFNVPDEWIIRHLTSISKIHQTIAYNFPVASNNRIDPVTIKEVQKRGGNIIGIKETINDVAHMLSFKDQLGEEFKVFNGPDQLLIPSLRSGLDGAIGSSSNYVPGIFTQVIDNYDRKEAFALHSKLETALGIVKSHGAWSANYSAIRILENIDAGNPRPPIFPLSNEQENVLRAELDFLKK